MYFPGHEKSDKTVGEKKVEFLMEVINYILNAL